MLNTREPCRTYNGQSCQQRLPVRTAKSSARVEGSRNEENRLRRQPNTGKRTVAQRSRKTQSRAFRVPPGSGEGVNPRVR